MDSYNVERFAKAAERRAFKEGLLSHFKDDADCIEMNKNNVKTFLDEPVIFSIFSPVTGNTLKLPFNKL